MKSHGGTALLPSPSRQQHATAPPQPRSPLSNLSNGDKQRSRCFSGGAKSTHSTNESARDLGGEFTHHDEDNATGDSGRSAEGDDGAATIRVRVIFNLTDEVRKLLPSQDDEGDGNEEEVESSPNFTKIEINDGVKLLQGLDQLLNEKKKGGNKEKKDTGGSSTDDSTQLGEGGEAIEEVPPSKLPWRVKSRLVDDWGNNKCREKYFPRPKGVCGNIVPPAYLFGRIKNVLRKAHALKYWHTLTEKKQKLLKRLLKLLEDRDKAADKARAAAEKAEKSKKRKAVRDVNRNVKRRVDGSAPKPTEQPKVSRII